MSIDAERTPGVVTIEYVADTVVAKDDSLNHRDKKKIKQLIIEGFGDMSLFHLPSVEVQYLYMDTAKTVSVPNDYVNYLKVGVPVQGKLKIATEDKSILLPRKFQDGKDVGNLDATNANPSVFFSDHFRNGKFVGGIYGAPGGRNTIYFREDHELRQIIFIGDVPRSEVVLEYVSTGVTLSGGTNIPRICVLPLQTYVFWQLAEYDRRVPGGEKERKKNNHLEEVSKLRAFLNTPTAQEYRDALYKSSRQSPKR